MFGAKRTTSSFSSSSRSSAASRRVCENIGECRSAGGVSDPRPAWSALAQLVEDDDRPRALLVRISCRGHV